MFSYTSEGSYFTITSLVYDTDKKELIESGLSENDAFASFASDSEGDILNIPSMDLTINIKEKESEEATVSSAGTTTYFDGTNIIQIEKFPAWNYD